MSEQRDNGGIQSSIVPATSESVKPQRCTARPRIFRANTTRTLNERENGVELQRLTTRGATGGEMQALK